MIRGKGFFILALAIRGFCGFPGPKAAGGSPVEAVVPQPWAPPEDRGGTIDFALSAQADAWLRHEALGDPSFDNFQHRPQNPILRGQAPFVWPVNGFLFEDPKSGNWYAYIGYYYFGYALNPALPPTHCRVHRSRDQGATWEEVGPIFNDPKFHFEGDDQPANIAPDVSVFYAENRYHLAYDWATDNLRWAEARDPPPGADAGVAYAWAEWPEGPFHRVSRPIYRTSVMCRTFDQEHKYRRDYGATIFKRAKDWLVLALTDSDEYFGWGVMAMTAADPGGQWVNPHLVLSVEGDEFYPPKVESFPAMVHDGWIYASSTSVALNRNFQVTYRAPLEEAHRPEAWRLYQYGTAWHSEPVPQETLGIWGQTYSGFVDRKGQYQVLFPSREPHPDRGTINLASRPWDRPLRDRGFTLSGHQGRSLTLLRYTWNQFHLKADLTLIGGPARLIWGYQAPLGADRHCSDATIHPLSLTRHQGLELSAKGWRVVGVDESGKTSALAEGPLVAGATRQIEIDLQKDGKLHLAIDGKDRWDGDLPLRPGPLGLLVDPWTNLKVTRFEVRGPFKPAALPWLYIEALSGAAVALRDWNENPSSLYRFGVGAVRNSPGGRVKWNFRGRGFRLWSPQGPQFGRSELLLDGRKLADLNFHADQEHPSRVVYTCEDAGDGYHAVVLRSTEGPLVVDSLDALSDDSTQTRKP